MIHVKDALTIILQSSGLSASRQTPLLDSLQKTLREDLFALHDQPTYNRASMDGMCLRIENGSPVSDSFYISRSIFPGDNPGSLLEGECAEIMTGAALPEHANAVIPFEWLSRVETQHTCHILQEADKKRITPGMNIHYRGSDCKAGELILKAGIKIGVQQLQMLYAFGFDSIITDVRPVIGIMSSGNELKARPSNTYEIRPGNLFFLKTLLQTKGYNSIQITSRDDISILHHALENLEKECEVILTTGAVSKGKADYIPYILKERGYTILFHGVKQRPGNPFLFAVHEKKHKVVFSFPGNPVAVMASALYYLIPFLEKKSGIKSDYILPTIPLAEDFEFNKPLTRFLSGKIFQKEGNSFFKPMGGNGSGDLITPGQSDGFLVLPSEIDTFKEGESYPFLPFSS